MQENNPPTPLGLSADFSAKTLPPRSKWHDIVKVLKGEHFLPRIRRPDGRHSIPKQQNTHSLRVPERFSRIDHMLDHKTIPKEFKKTEIISSIFLTTMA